MMEKVFLGKRIAVSLLLAILAGVSGPTFAAEVSDIRIATTETGTRVVLDLSAPARHQAFRLDDPRRIVLDVARSTLRAKLPAAEILSPAAREHAANGLNWCSGGTRSASRPRC
jgi:N-acetylmuramoyl-L-alanine amidase